MFKKIMIYGAVAGLISSLPSVAMTVMSNGHLPLSYSMVIGYLTMLIALSAVFVAIKRHRDADLGGVIKFWPALGLGLMISAVAGVFYVLAWEASQAFTHADFASDYAKTMIAEQQAKGASAAELAKLSADMESFKVSYANPLFRLPMIFVEIFPVGVLVSLVSAGLLRKSSFLPARRAGV